MNCAIEIVETAICVSLDKHREDYKCEDLFGIILN